MYVESSGGHFLPPANSEGMDYVHRISRLRPAAEPVSPLTPQARRRELSSILPCSAGGSTGIAGGVQLSFSPRAHDPRQAMYYASSPGTRRPAGYVPKSNRPISPRSRKVSLVRIQRFPFAQIHFESMLFSYRALHSALGPGTLIVKSRKW